MTNRRTVGFSLVLTAVIMLVASIVRPVDTQLGGQVEGSLFALVEDRRLPVSGITIYVKNAFTSIRGRNVTTDGEGRFAAPKQPPGTYQLCWEASGFEAECTSHVFVIENSTVLLSPVEITPKGGVIAGRITLLDGTPCRYFDPFFGVDVSPSVVLIDPTGAQITSPVLAHPSGDYLLTNVPSGTFRLKATCEGSISERTLMMSKAGNIIVDLTLENDRPVVLNVIATLNGQPVQGVPRGAIVMVTVDAMDVDGDRIHYGGLRRYPA